MKRMINVVGYYDNLMWINVNISAKTDVMKVSLVKPIMNRTCYTERSLLFWNKVRSTVTKKFHV